MSFRIENKYILQRNKFQEFYKFLTKNSFTTLYPKRNIHSVYFDNSKLSSYNESIEGLVPRKKIRIRNYPKPKEKNTSENFLFEIKINSVEGKYKISKNTINTGKYLREGYFDNNYGLCFPNVEVLYQRDYFSKADVRITLDSEIQYKFYQSKSGYSEKNIVVEIKSNNLNYNNIEEIYGLQKTRFSKYCEAIEHVGLSNN